jgi:hypothetical protein
MDKLFLLSPDDDTKFTCHASRKIRQRPKHPVRAFSEASADVVTVLPPDASPVDCRTEPNKLVIPVHVPKIIPPAQPPPYISTWTEYVANLPPWEHTPLLSVHFVDKRRMLIALQTAGRLFLASDGGAAAKRGSFGAVLATNDDILAECGGRAHGANPGSFRAEGYGILAILRLAFHLRFFYVTRNPALSLKLYYDSESLLKRIAASQALKRTLPRRFLYSEVDVEMQILSALQSLVAPVLFEHVEGHQDTKYPDKPLPWAAQLNQRCDEIATTNLN